jgi:GNAT superfamily N-acetyltransferase
MTQPTVYPVKNSTDLDKFIKLPWKIYKDDENWVPPLISDQKKFFDPEKNPFYEHANVQLFLAETDNEIVGRIAAIVNYRHNEFHDEKAGFFGFFETVQDYDVAEALFSQAVEWLTSEGMEFMRGPANFSSNDVWAFLLEGYDSPPKIMMPYNPPYYLEYAEKFGMEKEKDLFAFYLSTSKKFPERVIRIAEKIKKRRKITVRPINMKDFDNEVKIIRKIYNSAWEKNWGFVPMTEAEFDHLAEDLRQIVIPELVLIATVKGEPAAFSMTLPDVNQVLKKLDGKIFPFGWLKALWYFRKIDDSRLLTLGIKPGYRNLGINSILYLETFMTARNLGMKGGEMSWMLEENDRINRDMFDIGGELYKKYRIYRMEI